MLASEVRAARSGGSAPVATLCVCEAFLRCEAGFGEQRDELLLPALRRSQRRHQPAWWLRSWRWRLLWAPADCAAAAGRAETASSRGGHLRIRAAFASSLSLFGVLLDVDDVSATAIDHGSSPAASALPLLLNWLGFEVATAQLLEACALRAVQVGLPPLACWQSLALAIARSCTRPFVCTCSPD
jgi:hypothetical protein